MTRGRNEYNLRELAGAFGDLGTFIPFVVGYITVSHMDPVGMLVASGSSRSSSGSTSRHRSRSSP